MGFSLRVGGRGRMTWVHVPIGLWWAMHSTQKCHRFRKSLKSHRIVNFVQIGVAICPLAVSSAKGSELWERCCDGAR